MMKTKLIFIAIVAFTMTFCAHAATQEIRVSQLSGELTTNLRNILKSASPTDRVIIHFDKKGTYTLNGTIECLCSVEIKGLGQKKTTILLNNGSDQNGFKAFTDDTFIKCAGTPERPITVDMHDIAIRLKKHEGIWWENSARIGVKIYHASRVNIERVDSYADNAVFTNFDLRVCSNITIKNCNITCYNNCAAGGNLWIRGETRNVEISGNTLRKFGNDEMIAFFESTINAHTGERGHVARENIVVNDNQFIYGDSQFNDSISCDILLSFINVGDDIPHVKGYGCHNKNVEFTNNRFEINALCLRTISIGFREEDTQEDVKFDGNIFVNNDLDTEQRYTHLDILIKDFSAEQGKVTFSNNSFTNHMPVVNNFGTSGNIIAMLRGGNILLENNVITDLAPTSAQTNNTLGTTLIWCGEQGGSATLIGNEATGLAGLATVSEGAGILHFSLTASNNTFEGDTRIYCNNVNKLDLAFTGNSFKSKNMDFFLQEFAKEGSLIFNNNEVYAQGGQLMTHWANTNPASMRFNALEVKGNTFFGIPSESHLLTNIKNVTRRSIGGNTYYSR
ncbi:MAG: hypothetical protein PUE80_03125 [bacterium]|nr:hypothetical protein [bacterium]